MEAIYPSSPVKFSLQEIVILMVPPVGSLTTGLGDRGVVGS